MTASGPPAARCATPKAPRAASYTTSRGAAGKGNVAKLGREVSTEIEEGLRRLTIGAQALELDGELVEGRGEGRWPGTGSREAGPAWDGRRR